MSVEDVSEVVTKVCSKCQEEKLLSEFYKSKRGLFGTKSYCKTCSSLAAKDRNKNSVKTEEQKQRKKEYNKKYNEQNSDALKSKKKQYYVNNTQAILEDKRQYYLDNKVNINRRGKLYYENNKEQCLIRNKEYYTEHKEEISEKNKIKYYCNRDKLLEIKKQYYSKNSVLIITKNLRYARLNAQKVREYQTIYQKNFNSTEEGKRYNRVKSNRRRAALNNSVGSFTKEDVLALLVNQAYKCKYCGKDLIDEVYHVDHIFPISKYFYNGTENLQITCDYCNRSKRDKEPEVYEEAIGFLSVGRKKFLEELREFIISATLNKAA